jgi:hypothetical protein
MTETDTTTAKKTCPTRVVVALLVVFVGQLAVFSEVHQSMAAAAFGTKNDASDGRRDNDSVREARLKGQVRLRDEFQELIRESQTPSNCSDARIVLIRESKEFDGFALEVRSMAKYLQVAVASGRALTVWPTMTSAYAPECPKLYIDSEDLTENKFEGSNDGKSEDKNKVEKGGRWYCLWQPVSNCTVFENIGGMASDYVPPEPMGVGIIEEKEKSYLFDTRYYGPARIQRMDRFIHLDRVALADVMPHWERMYGRFWVRAQVSEYFWKHATDGLKHEIESRLPRSLLESREPYLAFHIRMTDNVWHLQNDFSRNATITRSFDRFMEIANIIRNNDRPDLRHIYVATDNDAAASRTIESDYPDWIFHIQEDVKRSDADSHFMWFRDHRAGTAGAIGADVETLRRADYLVGSFQSNVYRLAAELNSAHQLAKYLWDEKRIYSVDVEWYEDP